MLKRVIRKIKFTFLKQRVRTYKEFSITQPFDLVTPEKVKINIEFLRSYHSQYINEVSSSNMAASLELSGYLLSICQTNQYSHMLDMGSGFSSFILRYYAKENPHVKVVSVDDNVAWLDKTKTFLEQHQLDTKNIYHLDDFLNSEEKDFDLVLHDLNFVEVRINYVEQLIQKTKQGGVLIMDDVHKPDYLFALLSKLRKENVKLFDIKTITEDSFGRFALALVKE
ncbi:MAG: methyltransferase domain-containing protein [Bacteroidetes bacterium]|nr:methyltransferase domain-containing protein [Bacteroidota bacterium]